MKHDRLESSRLVIKLLSVMVLTGLVMFSLILNACTGRYEREDENGRTTIDWSSNASSITDDPISVK